MEIKELYRLFLQCESVATDTRKIENNTLFFALKGDNFNGNAFAKQALLKGARACIIDEKEYALNNQCILVENVLNTLQQLATYHRTQLNIPIIALTGSNGKTTTKELLNAVLSTTYRTTATKGNLNNHIGVPLTLLNMTLDTEIGIVEMGANHPHEIASLCKIALPDYGLITNFGKAHLEGFGNLEGVIKAKSELYDYLKLHSKLIFVNESDPIQVRQINSYSNIYFTSPDSSQLQLEGTQSLLKLKYNKGQLNTHLTGAYNLANIAVAIGVGTYFKVDSQKIAKAINNYIPANNRSQIIEKGSNMIIMDAYNANPTSMLAALENFKALDQTDKILFLGDMFELGSTARHEHQNIVDYIEKQNIGEIYLIGQNFYGTSVSHPNIHKMATFENLKKVLSLKKFTNKHLLIKGSRGMALERILELL